MLNKITKGIIFAIIFAGLGYAWRMSHEMGMVNLAKGAVMAEIFEASKEHVPFQVCMDDDKCMTFIPRADSTMKFNVVAREER